MKLSPKLLVAAAIALSSTAAFAVSNGDSDNDWLMKKPVPSGSSSAQSGSSMTDTSGQGATEQK